MRPFPSGPSATVLTAALTSSVHFVSLLQAYCPLMPQTALITNAKEKATLSPRGEGYRSTQIQKTKKFFLFFKIKNLRFRQRTCLLKGGGGKVKGEQEKRSILKAVVPQETQLDIPSSFLLVFQCKCHC